LSTYGALLEQQAHSAEVQRTEEMDLVDQQRCTVIHELSNSLAIVVLQSRLLVNRGAVSCQDKESLSIIQDQAQRMMRMLDSLRYNEDPLRPRPEAVDVNALIQQTLDIQLPQLVQDGIEVTTDLVDLPTTQADPYQLQQVFVNLINNARQAMAREPWGGTLAVAADLSMSGGDGTPRIQIRFADNGPGIPREVKPFLFTPFFTTKKQDRGMGLGLAICEQIVQRHNGAIWAENRVEGGATFIVELPVVGRKPASETPTPGRLRPERSQTAPPDVTASSYQILVVDDEPEVAHSTRQVLEQAGFQVTTASEVRQALDLLEQNPIDLIVSDLTMPQMNGQQFWRAVTRSHPYLTHRIIFSTGDSGGQRERSFLRDSGCAWIEKPFRASELVRIIHKVLPDERSVAQTPDGRDQ